MKRFITVALMACFMLVMATQQAMAVRPTVTDTIDNTVTADYDDVTGTGMPQESASVSVTVDQVYGVTIVATPDALTGNNGGYVIYPAVVTNTGNGPDYFDLTQADNAGTDWTPDAVAYYSDAPCTTLITTAGTALAKLAEDGGSMNVWIKVTVPVVGTAPLGSHGLTDLTATSATDPDVAPAANTDMVDTTVGSADLGGSTKVADATNYKANDTVTYTITLTNSGTVDATNIQVTDVIPAYLTYVSDTSGTSGYVLGTKTLTVNVADLTTSGPGSTYTFDIVCTVDDGAPNTGVALTNTAHITYTSGDNPNPEPAEDPFDDINIDAPDLAVTKTADVASAAPGEFIVYHVTVTNNGRDTANAVVISDTLSGFVTFDKILTLADGYIDPVNCAPSEAAGVISGNATGGVLAPGATMEFYYRVQVSTS